ncbi:MAG: hypothetical protein HUU55_04725 [Myxococcales bacterium]|nr:hypothetical protein [Myxococcales bacterium]
MPEQLEEYYGSIPELLSDVLDEDTCWQLFSDVANFGTDIRITVKCGHRDHGELVPITVGEAHEALVHNDVVAVQLRYGYQGCSWCDTVMRYGDGYRIIRIKSTN